MKLGVSSLGITWPIVIIILPLSLYGLEFVLGARIMKNNTYRPLTSPLSNHIRKILVGILTYQGTARVADYS
jgi:hypothetical protein